MEQQTFYGIRYETCRINWQTGRFEQVREPLTYEWRGVEMTVVWSDIEEARCVARSYVNSRVVKIKPEQAWTWLQFQKLGRVGRESTPWVVDNLMATIEFQRIAKYFPHVHPDDPKLVRFTASPEHGMRGRYTVMKPTKFLLKYGEFEVERAEQLGHQYAMASEPGELHFATTGDDIERVYLDGPNSCMAHSASSYATGGIHPSRVYESPDLQVAYIKLGDRITSRTIVWPDKKQHTLIYGDERRMKAKLHELGYEFGNFEGARLKRIEASIGEIVMPYLDCCKEVIDDGDYIRIEPYGHHYCDNTNGLMPVGGPSCDGCGDCIDEDEGNYIETVDEHWCDHCTEVSATWCEAEQVYARNCDVVELSDGEYATSGHFRNYGYTCEATDYRSLDLEDFAILEDGQLWHLDYFDRNGFTCVIDRTNHDREDGIELPDGEWINHSINQETIDREMAARDPNQRQLDLEAA